MRYLFACIFLYTLHMGVLCAQTEPFQQPAGILWGLKRGTDTVLTASYGYIAPFNPYGFAIARRNELYGILDTTGREHIPCRYAFISWAADTSFLVQEENREGHRTTVLFDRQGREHSYDSILFQGPPQGNYFRVFRPRALHPNNQGIIDRQGRLLLPAEYRHIDILDSSFIAQNGRGYRLFRDGENIDISVHFEILRPLSPLRPHTALPLSRFTAGDHSRDRILVYESDGLCGILDIRGNLLCAAVYQEIEPFSDGLARVRRNLLYGFIDSSGTEIIPAVYEEACSFSSGYAVVQKNGKTGLLHCSGREILPALYRDIPGKRIRPGIADRAFSIDLPESFYVRSTQINGIPELPWDILHRDAVSEGLIAFCNDSACGYADTSGRIVIPAVYQNVAAFREGRAAVQQNGKWGYTDPEGHTVIPCIYDVAGDFQSGCALVQKGPEQALIGRDGEYRTPLRRKVHVRIGEKLVRIYANRGMHILKNTEGKTVLQRYSHTAPMADSTYLHVVRRHKHGIISTEGKTVVPMEYSYIDERLLSLFFTVAKGRGRHKKYGLCSLEGTVILPLLFDKPPVLHEGIISSTHKGTTCAWNLRGKQVHP